jgi:nucleotide-binding universal stress UspA family protein
MADAVAAARRAAGGAGRSSPRVTGVLAAGNASDEISLRARAEDADLVVLGRHGRRALRDVFLGSTAHRVVRTADLPVLVVNDDPTRRYASPVAAVDLEVPSRQVVEVLLRVLGPRPPAVELFHAFEVSFEGIAFPGMDATKLNRWGEKFRREAKARLGDFVDSLPDLGVRWRPAVLSGSAATAILEEIRRRDPDLVALGTHGRSPLSRLLLGSVAERVLAGASCDVVVARPARMRRAVPPSRRPATRRRAARLRGR